MTPDMTTRYGLKREMASSKHTLSILNEYGMSKPRVWLEYGWSMARVWVRYAVCLILMMIVGVNEMWGAFTEGLYYIKSNQNTAYYLCPSIGCYYGNNVDQPHLTTFKTGGDQYSIWKIVPVENEADTYYIIHYKTGRYLKSNEDFTTVEKNQTKHNRKAVHLEVKPETLTDAFKFLIKNNSSPYQIYPKVYWNTDVANMSFNPTNEHQDCYAPADGAVENGGAKGMIGLYSKTDNFSKWQIPSVASAPCATPIIKYDGDNINISYPYSDETGITIYYTTDGSDPSTGTSNASTNFNISASGVIKVRAIATKTGLVNSDEAVLWGSAKPFLIQSKECADYYLVPAGNGTNVNTSSLPGTSMQWTLQNAETSTGGVQYYYVVNNNKRINYNSSDNTLTLNEASADANKFCVVENGYNTGGFFLIPVSQTNRILYKDKGNVEANNCYAGLNKKWDTNLDQWNLRVCNETADQKNLFSTAPFSVSNDDETHYYHIASIGADGYYIVPPADPDGYATTSNTSADYTDNPWIFKVAASDNWLTYYYIINAASGKYMYFNPNTNQTPDQENVISLKDISEKNAENEEKFQFIMVRSTTTDACYIVSKGYSYADASHRNFYNNRYYGLCLDESNPLKTTWSRQSDANNIKWTFVPTTYTNVWADPEISCDLNGNISITNGEETDGAEFYYTINNSTTLPATPTATESETNFKYNSLSMPTVSAGFTTIKVRAIASGKRVSNVVTKTIVYNPTITFTADSYTYLGITQNPIHSVDVSSTNIASTEYNVTYKKGGVETVFKDAGDYTIELTDAEGGDYIVSGSATKSIAKADITAVSASIEGWMYGGLANTPSVTANVVIEPEAVVYEYKLSSADDDTYTQDVPINAGSYLLRASIPETDNFNGAVTTSSFTISPKLLGDGTKAAEGFVITMTDNGSGGYNVSVQDGEEPLTELTDYELTEENDVVTITGIHNYTGSARLVYATATFATPDALNVPAENGYAAAYMSKLDVSAPSSMTVYVVKKVNASIGTVNISKIDYIPEGVPVLMLANSDLSGFATSPIDESTTLISDAVRSSNKLQVAPDEPSDPEDANSTHGVAVKDKEAYMFYKGEFVLTQEGTIGAGKFFIYNPNYTPSSGGGGTPAPARRLQIVIEDDPTSISEDIKVNHEEYNTAGSWYTISGQRLNGKPNQKGIYIKNGQKMIIR